MRTSAIFLPGFEGTEKKRVFCKIDIKVGRMMKI
ncbi:hypothetical protein BVRB_5g125500 [Beta vulgaris subsp. vulgaris]|uniref:Uncharacterized protein n=1 Tax=Beta vulgaris subsp. vulgaris TaxID=3555 RepID=A0A0J8B8J0_BETVV|nr:hypothetical protein BVRB_5g125500 [Beta vulgaris subsp. vulgaris]